MNFSRKNHEHHKTNRCFVSKNQLNYRFIFLALISVFLISTGFQDLNAQAAKKNKIRLKADYVKIMDGESYLDITATSKIEKKNTKVSNIDLIIYNEFDDEKIKLGNILTNMKGESRFVIKNLNAIIPDSTNTYTILISFKGNDSFKKASKRISFKNADIESKLIVKDSINYITATLTDASTNSPIIEESLTVQVQRLFRPLRIGEEFNNTDENGTIVVQIEEGIPGVDGNLTLEVVLSDNDDYGTVKALVNAPLGIPIVDESDFDKRTMWAPRNKTPIFLLIFPNLLIFGIWALLIYLIINLFKISKSKI
ncbi:MAG: hypothetical protein KAJ28_04585 [Flavobacteriaceae bacterium]|nr:hypothetical protein [Flavobacteriaceae bacterium]